MVLEWRKYLTWHQSRSIRIQLPVSIRSLTILIYYWHLLYCPYTVNEIVGDKSALVPGGIRIGSPAMTTRGFSEKEFVTVADLINEGVQITLEAKNLVSGSKLQDFMKFVTSPEFPLIDKVLDLKRRVEALTTQYPLPGLWWKHWWRFQ